MKRKIFDVIIVALVAWALYLLFTWRIESAVSTSSWNNLKYFTVQSNILMGLVCLWNLVSNRDHPYFVLAGTVSLALTALTVVAFLGPVFGWEIMYMGFNLYMHAIVPILAIIRFMVCQTGKDIKFSGIWKGSILMILYGIVYAANIIVNGISRETDWYGFAMWGRWSIIPVFIIIFAITYLLGLIIWKLGGGRR